MKKLFNLTLLYCFIITFACCIEECSEVIRYFRNYTCKSEEVFDKGSAGKVFKVLKDQKLYMLKHQPKSARSEAELKYLEKVKNVPYVIQLLEEKTVGNDVFTIINFGHKGSMLDVLLNEEDYFLNDIIVMKMFHKILEGVIEIHKRNIVHADLKLENIVVDDQDDPYIIDFDLAVEMNSSNRGRGSLKYAAPEVLNAMHNRKPIIFDEKIDTYSLGVILYALMTESFPFDIEPRNDNLSDIVKNSPLVFEEGFNEDIKKMILSCIQVKEFRTTTEQLLEKVTKFLLKPTHKALIKEEVYTMNEMEDENIMKEEASELLDTDGSFVIPEEPIKKIKESINRIKCTFLILLSIYFIGF